MFFYSRNIIILIIFIPIFLGLTLSPIFLPFQNAQADVMPTSVSVIVSVCGNGIKEASEQCDGADLGGQTCQGLGYVGGTLSCYPNCTFNTSGCTAGGGGGGGALPPVPTQVILQGKAYPLVKITILKDGQVVNIITADSLANFKAEFSDLTAGVYTFSVWAKDKKERKSITFSFTVSVIKGLITTISDIFLPPTIDTDKTSVAKGEILNILGQSAPQSEITIKVSSPEENTKTTTTTNEGDWDHPLDTSSLQAGIHYAKAKADYNNGELVSSYSNLLAFAVGKATLEELCPRADLNKDGKTNLVDFSILLYWWGKQNSCADQNQDGWVNLPDFSIMMYWWTG